MKKITGILIITLLVFGVLCGCDAQSVQQEQNYTIQYYIDGKIYEEIETKGDLIVFPVKPSNKNVLFEGWYLDRGFRRKFTEDYFSKHKVDNGTVKVYGKTTHYCYVNLMDDDEIIQTMKIMDAKRTYLPVLPDKYGKKFLGWSLSKDKKEIITPIRSFKTDTILYAFWQDDYRKTTQVTYKILGNTYVLCCEIGGPIIDLKIDIENPQIDRFEGWFLDEQLLKPVDYDRDTVTNNMVLYGEITNVNTPKYNVYFESNIPQFDRYSIKVSQNKNIALLNKQIENHTMIDWQVYNMQGELLEKRKSDETIFFMRYNHDIKIVANYKPIISFTYLQSQDAYKAEIGMDINSKTLEIPNTYQNKKVIEISSKHGIVHNEEKIIIPDNVKIIDENTFEYSTKLRELQIGKGLQVIKNYAFKNTGLKVLNIPKDSQLKLIENDAFEDAELEEIIIDDSVTQLTMYMTNLSKLIKVDLGGVTEVFDHSFSGCNKLCDIDLSKVTKIGEKAFCYNHSLKELDLTSLQSLGDSAFESCKYLHAVEISDTLTHLGSLAFDERVRIFCKNLSKPDWNITGLENYKIFYDVSLKDCITIDNRQYILHNGSAVLYNCLLPEKEIALPDYITYNAIKYAVKGVLDFCFVDSPYLNKLYLPDDIQYIGGKLFTGHGWYDYNQKDGDYFIGSKTNPYLILAGSDNKILRVKEQSKIIACGISIHCYPHEQVIFEGEQPIRFVASNGLYMGGNNLHDIVFLQGSKIQRTDINAIIIDNGILLVDEDLKNLHWADKCVNGEVYFGVAQDKNLQKSDHITYIKCQDDVVAIQNDTINNIKYIAIPNSISFGNRYYPVTKISKNLFVNCNIISKLFLPESITEMNNNLHSVCNIYFAGNNIPKVWKSEKQPILGISYSSIVCDSNGYMVRIIDNSYAELIGNQNVKIGSMNVKINIPQCVVIGEISYPITHIRSEFFQDVYSIGGEIHLNNNLSHISVQPSLKNANSASSVQEKIYLPENFNTNGFDKNWNYIYWNNIIYEYEIAFEQ